jgi:2-succinyl-6-hydroxy-2,4-cyclohexadiene-1-carboxylate synthase
MTVPEEMTVFFFHGFLGQPADWKQVVAHLTSRARWRFHCVNLWKDLPLIQFTSMTEWLDAFVDKYRAVAPAVLCGYSLGGRLGMALACRHPEFVHALVAISGHPGLVDEAEKHARVVDDQRWGQIFKRESWEGATAQWNAREVFGGHRTQPLAESYDVRELQVALDIFSLGRQPNLRPCLQGLAIPILWVVGERDAKFSALAREGWLDQSRIQVAQIPSCGHRLPHECPQQLACLLNDFFTGLEKDSSHDKRMTL